MSKKMNIGRSIPWHNFIMFRFEISGYGPKHKYSYFSVKKYINNNITGAWAYSAQTQDIDNNYYSKEVFYVAFKDSQDSSQFKLAYGDCAQQVKIWPSGLQYFIYDYDLGETSNNEIAY
jgi:hypothetical protein